MFATSLPAQETHWTDPYNVTWTTPSKEISGTMPLANGATDLNVRVQDGDLKFLIGKSDAWDESAINCKLARVRGHNERD